MAFPGLYENRDGTEAISTIWVEDKRKLCLILDARDRWKDLGEILTLSLSAVIEKFTLKFTVLTYLPRPMKTGIRYDHY